MWIFLNFLCLGDPKLRDLGQFVVLHINYDVITLQNINYDVILVTSSTYVT